MDDTRDAELGMRKAAVPSPAVPSRISPARSRRLRAMDWSFRWLTGGLAFLVLLLLAGVALSLFLRGWEAFHHFGFAFFWNEAWDPVTENFGALVPIYGTLVSSLIAMLIAVPISFGIALFISELAPEWLRQPVGSAIELLAGIPSIIFGMWGLFVFAPVLGSAEPWLNDHLGALRGIGALFRGPPMGIGMLTAGIILAIMVIPFISAIMRDVFLVVPTMLKESAYGLGATTWEVARHVVLPYTRTAVVGGVFLGLGRALGETMAVTFVIGNAQDLHISLLDAGNSIAAALANEFAEAFSPMYKSALMALGFILFIITFVVLVLAKLMLWHLGQGQGKAGL